MYVKQAAASKTEPGFDLDLETLQSTSSGDRSGGDIIIRQSGISTKWPHSSRLYSWRPIPQTHQQLRLPIIQSVIGSAVRFSSSTKLPAGQYCREKTGQSFLPLPNPIIRPSYLPLVPECHQN
ncbi:hypothetical protein BaRGS_00010607 [Batillaria attramentaria]|uniref:Uncharacterized protein n=1 Tax=Batillaria attramentaria TaxID=370345 RepID=A0ABD0LEY9_9CAEN